MSSAHPAGNHLLPDHAVMEVRVADLRQLFNRMDPSPFRERDLDPSAEEFIIGWAQTVPAGKPLALVVHLERSAESPDEPAVIRDAIRDFFRHESDRAARRLRQLFQRGRISLGIAVLFLFALFAIPATFAQVVSSEDVTDEELTSFANAYVDVEGIQGEYEQAIAATEEAEEVEALRARYQEEINQAIAARGMESDRYDAIVRSMQSDTEFAQRAHEKIQEVRDERMGG